MCIVFYGRFMVCLWYLWYVCVAFIVCLFMLRYVYCMFILVYGMFIHDT